MGKIDGGLRALFRANLPGFDWTSIESGTTGGGIPDMNYCRDGVEGWCELKQTPGHAVTLRPEQIGWIARRVRNGGRVWIAVRQQCPAGPRREARDALWLVPGRWAKEAKMFGLRGAWVDVAHGVLVQHHGPARWDWQAIARALVS
jgi:hypothetical protein